VLNILNEQDLHLCAHNATPQITLLSDIGGYHTTGAGGPSIRPARA